MSNIRSNKGTFKNSFVFEKIQVTGDDIGKIINQVKQFECTYIEPYIIIADQGAKILFIIKPGGNYTIFNPFEQDILYIKGSPYKNCPLLTIGNDIEGSGKALKAKFIPWGELQKVIYWPSNLFRRSRRQSTTT